MNESHPFSMRIFVANGDPDGLRIIERSNWNGRAMVFPRPLLPEVKKREEFGFIRLKRTSFHEGPLFSA